MFESIRRLILVDAQKLVFVPKGKSEEVTKMKYTFYSKDGTYLEAFEDMPGTYQNDVETIAGWDESKAKDFVFQVKLFKGLVSYKLVPKTKST